jgi:dolichol-phosphate mannosyltransferase
MKCVIVVPTYNERESIIPLIAKLEEVFLKIQGHRMLVLVVDDSSPDGTGEVVKEMAASRPYLHLLSRPRKEGLGAAYVAGMDYARERLDAEVLFEIDADLSHDPELIPDFLEEIDKGADFVIGSRYLPQGSVPGDWGLRRKLISRIGNLGIRFALGHLDVTEWSNGFRAIRTWVFAEVKDDLKKFRGYTFQVAFLHKAIHRGAVVVEIPCNFVDRRYGRSKFPAFAYVTDTFVYVLTSRLREIFSPTVRKFLVVGAVGFFVNLVGLEVLVRLGLPPSLATALGAEAAIVSNFVWNNFWTFNHVRLELGQIPFKFLQFNLASAGAVAIQFLVLKAGELYWGVEVFKMRVFVGVPLARYHFFFLGAVVLGLFWNFFFYSRVVWKS